MTSIKGLANALTLQGSCVGPSSEQYFHLVNLSSRHYKLSRRKLS